MKTTAIINRRSFLGMTVAAGLAPFTARASVATTLFSAGDRATSWAALTCEQMQAMVGQTFEIVSDNRPPVRVQLVQVDRLSTTSRPAWLLRKQPFNARFRAQDAIDAATLENATVRHRTLGASKLLLTEVPTASGLSIESVFA